MSYTVVTTLFQDKHKNNTVPIMSCIIKYHTKTELS